MTARGEYLPIGQHGLVGDMHTAALVGVDGTVAWYCPGRFDAPSLFASLLDSERGGHWRIGPSDDGWTQRQLYLSETPVLLTRFASDDGVVEVEDWMPVGGVDGRRGLVRRATCVRGSGSMRCDLQPRPDYARAEAEVELVDAGAVLRHGGAAWTLHTDASLEVVDGGLAAELEMSHGDVATFMLLDGEPDGGPDPDGCVVTTQAVFDDTVAFWRGWLAQSGYRGRWREIVHRSALTLKLLTYAPTGALVAAPTTSLPERVGGERNWDYRYTWIRDAAFSVYGLLRLGFSDEARDFIGWLTDRVQHDIDDADGPLRVMYAVDGGSVEPEVELDHLEGYMGSSPVRVGNGAGDQFQLDIYGELVDSMYLYNKYGDPLFSSDWEHLARMVDWVCAHWDQQDHGIWEVRSGKQRFTHSRLMCWVAVERAMRVAQQRGLPADLATWSAARDAIYEQLMDEAYDTELGAFTQHLDGTTMDAAVLLMPLLKFIAPTDPRWLSTLDVIEERLVSDDLVHRYDPEAAPDGIDGEEGTFSMATFWYVEALARAGRVEQARLVFDRMLTYASPLGLYAEEVGPRGELLGNFPQAFTHLALISAAFYLDRVLDEAAA